MSTASGGSQIYLHSLAGRDSTQAIARHGDGGPIGDLWHVLFAYRVKLRPFDEIIKRKWGFNLGVLMEEAHDRQRLFVATQHFAGERFQDEHRRTLSLRCRSEPGGRRLQLSLLGKVCGPDPDTAARSALEYARELKSIFPYEYQLSPATTPEEFQACSGQDLLLRCTHPGTLVEIERFETEIGPGPDRCYLPGAWGNSARSNEQIWRALAGAGQAVLFSVMLRPEPLQEQNLAVLLQITQDLQKSLAQPAAALPHGGGTGQLAAAGAAINRQEYLRYAARQYGRLAAALRRPYLVQVHLAAPDGLPKYLLRAVGAALTYTEKPEQEGALVPGFQVSSAQIPAVAQEWIGRLQSLEPNPGAGSGIDPRFQSVRRLVDLQDACFLFRWPLPPENGLPDMELAG